MARLLLGNIEDGTSDEEIRELLVKYGFPDFDEIEHAEGAGRPAVVLTFQNTSPEALRLLQGRIHDLFWKKRRLTAQILADRYA
jgi:hypothetical protein